MTNAVKDIIEEFAAKDGITEIKSALQLPQSDWIVGVDYDQDKFGKVFNQTKITLQK